MQQREKLEQMSLFLAFLHIYLGSEFLEHVMNVSIPDPGRLFAKESNSADLATHIISTLYRELDEFCLIQDGEEDAYGTLLLLFVGCLRPMIESLDTWLQEGTLNDPAEELFFYAESSTPIENAGFWEHGYCLREAQDLTGELELTHKGTVRLSSDIKTQHGVHTLKEIACPCFLHPFAKAIVSAGKSLQLLQYVWRENDEGEQDSGRDTYGRSIGLTPYGYSSCIHLPVKSPSEIEIGNCEQAPSPTESKSEQRISLFEEFCTSLQKLLGEAIVKSMDLQESVESTLVDSCIFIQGNSGQRKHAKKVTKLPALKDLGYLNVTGLNQNSAPKDYNISQVCKTVSVSDCHTQHSTAKWELQLNQAGHCQLPSLDDARLRSAVFGSTSSEKVSASETIQRHLNFKNGNVVTKGNESNPPQDVESVFSCNFLFSGTDFNFGAGCGKLLHSHNAHYLREMEKLLPYPTALPSFQDGCAVSQLLPAQGNNKHATSIFHWLQHAKFRTTPSPSVLIQECLISFIQKQVDKVGQQLLERLMGQWQLMEELALLRAIYLVGSGDLLQQFSSVLFNKLDRGEPWDDFYELNTMLQESVRSSSHGVVLPALDSLLVTVLPRLTNAASPGPSPHQIPGRASTYGIETLDSLFVTYKVAWPLEVIIDSNAIKKYNQVMLFLLKVKRAKHALDKACRWTWKNGIGNAVIHKQRLLLQQKLMHFVNTLHQYVMDRVLYSAWVELCESMASAGSLDEVIACHDAYLVSIQRQCLVAPDKLWTLIASRVKTILGLALNYYSIQRMLFDGGGAPATSAKCQVEIDRVEKQFDECMVFLMRVLSFKLNVGHFPHLADLVTRINYNFYYMTEDGQLLTPVPDSQGPTRRSTRRP